MPDTEPPAPVVVDLPDCVGGGQLLTITHTDGTTDQSWRQHKWATWLPVDQGATS